MTHHKVRETLSRISARNGWAPDIASDGIETKVGRKNRYGQFPESAKTIMLATTAELLVSVRDELLAEDEA